MTESLESAPLEMRWDSALVPLEALERTFYALAKECTGTVRADPGEWVAEIHPIQSDADRTALAHRVRREVNDQALRIKVAEQTAPLRNVVFALAFSRTGLADSGEAP